MYKGTICVEDKQPPDEQYSECYNRLGSAIMNCIPVKGRCPNDVYYQDNHLPDESCQNCTMAEATSADDYSQIEKDGDGKKHNYPNVGWHDDRS